jgi:hypothetical protein
MIRKTLGGIAGGLTGVFMLVGLVGGAKGCTVGDGGLLHRKQGSTWEQRFIDGFADSTKRLWHRGMEIIEETDPEDIEEAARRTREAAKKVGGAVAEGLTTPQPVPTEPQYP